MLRLTSPTWIASLALPDQTASPNPPVMFGPSEHHGYIY
nr:MAG TPA: hypothetical protein [Caudoviricetes sp.]